MTPSSYTIKSTPITTNNFSIKYPKYFIGRFRINATIRTNFRKCFQSSNFNTSSSPLDDKDILPRRTKFRKRTHKRFIRHLLIFARNPSAPINTFQNRPNTNHYVPSLVLYNFRRSISRTSKH